jgi:hypothetical protein
MELMLAIATAQYVGLHFKLLLPPNSSPHHSLLAALIRKKLVVLGEEEYEITEKGMLRILNFKRKEASAQDKEVDKFIETLK